MWNICHWCNFPLKSCNTHENNASFMSVHLHMSLSLKPYSWHIVHYANHILCLFNHDFQWEKLERRRFRIVKRDRLPRSSEENKPSEVSEENRRLSGSVGLWSVTWTGWRFHVVVLLVPLHGTVVTQHHLPQGFAEVRQAGNVAVQGDMLPTEKWWK